MQVKKRRTSPVRNTRLQADQNGKRSSLRDLKAFGIWAERTDLKDPVQFTRRLRARMEQGDDAR
jgi:hypothetical protein